jgi:hypothetical protein
MNVKDFIVTYQNVIDLPTCKSMVEDLENNHTWKKHHYTRHDDLSEKTYEDDFYVTKPVCGPVFNINNIFPQVIDRYIKHELNQIMGNNTWFNTWSSFSHLRVNKYTVDTNMKMHCDHIKDLFDGERKGIPILTLLGSLNNDYEGGDLIILDEKFSLPAGSIMVFPSNFMYPHKVENITKGIRYSFVSWIW